MIGEFIFSKIFAFFYEKPDQMRFNAKRITGLWRPTRPANILDDLKPASDTLGRHTASRSQAVFLLKCWHSWLRSACCLAREGLRSKRLVLPECPLFQSLGAPKLSNLAEWRFLGATKRRLFPVIMGCCTFQSGLFFWRPQSSIESGHLWLCTGNRL